MNKNYKPLISAITIYANEYQENGIKLVEFYKELHIDWPDVHDAYFASISRSEYIKTLHSCVFPLICHFNNTLERLNSIEAIDIGYEDTFIYILETRSNWTLEYLDWLVEKMKFKMISLEGTMFHGLNKYIKKILTSRINSSIHINVINWFLEHMNYDRCIDLLLSFDQLPEHTTRSVEFFTSMDRIIQMLMVKQLDYIKWLCRCLHNLYWNRSSRPTEVFLIIINKLFVFDELESTRSLDFNKILVRILYDYDILGVSDIDKIMSLANIWTYKFDWDEIIDIFNRISSAKIYNDVKVSFKLIADVLVKFSDGLLEVVVTENGICTLSRITPPYMQMVEADDFSKLSRYHQISSVTSEDAICAICKLENMVNGLLTPCNHKFCARCILTWLVLNNNCSCPLCRQKIDVSDLFILS